MTHSSQFTEILVYLSLLRALLILSSPCCSDREPTRKPEHYMRCISGHFRRCLPVSLMQGLTSSRFTGMLQAELTLPLNLLSKPLAPAPSGELHHCQPYCIPTETTMASTMQGMWIQTPTADSCHSPAGHQRDQKPATYLLADTGVCPHRWAHTASPLVTQQQGGLQVHVPSKA